MSTILKTKSITKHYSGVHAVDNLSISFESGKITGIIGPNGSGKSTLINLFSGIVPIDSGSVIFDNAEELGAIKTYEVADYGLTRTFQEVRLFEQIPVFDNILAVVTKRNVISSIFETHKKFHLDRAEAVLKRVGLWEKRNELAKNLSYGQRKLLEIARILAMTSGEGMEGEIFLFDEPFAGLFQEMREVVLGIMKELKEKGKTVILIEHNMEIIRNLCDHVFVLDSGKLLAQGTPEEVLSKKEVIEAYLGK